MKLTTASALALGLSAKALADTTWSDWDPTTYSSSTSTSKSSSTSTGWSDWETTSKTTSSTTSTTATWSDWDPKSSSSPSISTGWGAWTTSSSTTYSTPAAPVSAAACCASYIAGGDSWGFPVCADPGVAAAATGTWSYTEAASATGAGPYSASNVPTALPITTGYLPTTGLDPSKTWSINPIGTLTPNYTDPEKGWPSNSCNTPSNRGSWCYGLDIKTDPVTTWPNTGHVCEYDFTITNTTVNYDGTPKLALAVNGQVPGPPIICNWGDTVKITVHNKMTNNGTTIHWHGIRQLGTNPNDGAPGITECALAPGDSRVYQWQATSHGTSWYHSHFNTQYGDGIHGPIVINGPTTASYDVDMGPVMVDDIYNHTAPQEYSLISHGGPLNAANYLLNGKNTKPNLSAGEHQLWTVDAGKKYLFRIINSATQSMWVLGIDNHTFEVISSDFIPIVPYSTTTLKIGIGQRYDVIVTMNQPVGSYFFRAATQLACPGGNDNTGFGLANGIIRYNGASSSLPANTPSFAPPSTGICADEPYASLVPYIAKTAGTSSAFSASASTLPAGNISLIPTSDDGAVFRWFLNGNSMTVDPTKPTLEILAKAGTVKNSTFSLPSNVVVLNKANTWVYFVIQNEFFAAHPMHLHGHDFSLLGQGVGFFNPSLIPTLDFTNPPRRDTAMLAGSGWTVIGFETDNPGAWLMHCHIAWHIDGGLGMQFVERPSDIPAQQWALSTSFQDQCKNYVTYDKTAIYPQSSGDSGLKVKRSDLADYNPDVVRRADGLHRRYVRDSVRRGLGDSARRH